MNKIVKNGQRTFAATCGVCGCIFTYESEDVQDALNGPATYCPCCKSRCPHKLGVDNDGFYVTVENRGV